MRTNQYKPTKYNNSIEKLLNQFDKKSTTIPFNFRTAVTDYKSADYYTHLIHPYPAKLLMHIPRFFLENTFFSREGDIILDPFCGSGTVLLEAGICKRNSIGVDANPFARLISSVKVNYIPDKKLINTLEMIEKKWPQVKHKKNLMLLIWTIGFQKESKMDWLLY